MANLLLRFECLTTSMDCQANKLNELEGRLAVSSCERAAVASKQESDNARILVELEGLRHDVSKLCASVRLEMPPAELPFSDSIDASIGCEASPLASAAHSNCTL